MSLRSKEAKAVKERLEKAKNKRLLNEKLEGKRLGEVDEEEESLLSAADWVRRSRLKEVSDKEVAKIKAEEMAKKLEDADDEVKYEFLLMYISLLFRSPKEVMYIKTDYSFLFEYY